MNNRTIPPNYKKDLIMLTGLALVSAEKTRTYVMLSLNALIYDHNNQPFDCKHLNIHKLNHLLKISLSDKTLEIPHQTYHWFWKDELFDGRFYSELCPDQLTLRKVIQSPTLLRHHAKDVADILLDKLPIVLKWKLGFKNKGRYYRFRDIVIDMLYTYPEVAL